MDGNFIKLDRKILQWEWYKNEHTKNVFLHCLLKAYWMDTKIEGKTIPRGSFASSITHMAEELDLTVAEVRTALKHLKLTNEVTSRGTNRNTVFTVTNYDLYQSKGQAEQQADNEQITNEQQTDNEQITNKKQTINKPLTTNKEYKEYEEGEEEKESKKHTPLYPPARGREEAKLQKQIAEQLPQEIPVSDFLLEHINEWLEYKKERRFAYKERGLKTLLRQVSENARRYGDKAVARAISDSIANGYQGIIWEKAEKLGRNNAATQDEPSESSSEDEGNGEELVGDDW